MRSFTSFQVRLNLLAEAYHKEIAILAEKQSGSTSCSKPRDEKDTAAAVDIKDTVDPAYAVDAKGVTPLDKMLQDVRNEIESINMRFLNHVRDGFIENYTRTGVDIALLMTS